MNDNSQEFMTLSDAGMTFGDVILNACFVLSVRSGTVKQRMRFLIPAYLRVKLSLT